MKRFYKMVSIAPAEGGYGVFLDGKPVKTPARVPLIAPSRSMADQVQREWADQDDEIRPATMPLTQLLTTKIDRVSQEREAMTRSLLKYIDTDLLCYRTALPEALAEKQAAAWDPWLDWFAQEFGTRLQTTTALAALTQPPAAHAAATAYIEALDDDHFTVLQLIAPLSGSIVLAMAFTRRAIGAGALFDTVRVDENYKAALYDEEKYGPDPAQGKKDAAFRADLESAENFLSALS